MAQINSMYEAQLIRLLQQIAEQVGVTSGDGEDVLRAVKRITNGECECGCKLFSKDDKFCEACGL